MECSLVHYIGDHRRAYQLNREHLMPFDNSAFVEVQAAVERDLRLYRQVMEQRKHLQQRKEHQQSQGQREERPTPSYLRQAEAI